MLSDKTRTLEEMYSIKNQHNAVSLSKIRYDVQQSVNKIRWMSPRLNFKWTSLKTEQILSAYM